MSLFFASVRSAFKSSFWMALDICGERSFRNCKNAFAEFLVAKYFVFNFDLCLAIVVLIWKENQELACGDGYEIIYFEDLVCL